MASLGGQVYEEGTHLMIPWFEWPYIYDVRARPNVIQSTSGSKDLQMVRGVTSADRSLLRAKLCRDRALAA